MTVVSNRTKSWFIGFFGLLSLYSCNSLKLSNLPTTPADPVPTPTPYSLMGQPFDGFGTNGLIMQSITAGMTAPYTAKDGVTDLLLTSDGQLLISGSGSNFAGGSPNGDGFMARFTAAGALDTTFNSTGVVPVIDRTYLDRGFAVIDAGTSYYLLGSSRSGAAPATSECYLAKHHLDGSLDTGFNTTGYLRTSFGGSFCFMHDAILLADGKFIVAFVYYPPASTTVNFMLTRLNADGTVDSTFGTSGYTTLTANGISNTNFGQMKVRATQDGGYLVMGYRYPTASTTELFLAAVTSTGVMNPGFGTSGFKAINPGYLSYGGSFDLDGDKILVPVEYRATSSSPYVSQLLKLNSDGTPDASFGNSGYSAILTDYSTLGYFYNTVKVAGSKYYLGGAYYFQIGASPTSYHILVHALNSNGSTDTTFGSQGVYQYSNASLLRTTLNALVAGTDYLLGCGNGSTTGSDDDIVCFKMK